VPQGISRSDPGQGTKNESGPANRGSSLQLQRLTVDPHAPQPEPWEHAS
jgi:hypothetical protein